MSALLEPWDGDIAKARRLQAQLAMQLVLEDDFPTPLRSLGGFDAGFEAEGTVTHAAALLMDADTLQPTAQRIARLPTCMPYIPGLLSFRELPALLAALAGLPQPPQLAFIDGHGIAHPRRLGIAAHFGIATGLASIGVAKKPLCGSFDPPGPEPGDRTRLMHRGAQIGWVLRSKRRCNPLFVSPGHRVSMASAAELVMRCLAGYRLPEPTRLADRLASQRDGR
ncbi:Endonuclease V [Pseudoxanthomonas wuyuanensis]|uniref:Endonuclease V n=1 Tax=Pseudoxanthomonas wuyuanensis TaxID=1073196 RepID=A0A286DGH8_9GAMM|nr:deoxyribonuclease V [Pseudoxanthomonas wuyuanensis]SOD57684.1 Endonuclease V [Pseudoxanthomonas wuyuanensis]